MPQLSRPSSFDGRGSSDGEAGPAKTLSSIDMKEMTDDLSGAREDGWTDADADGGVKW